MKVSKQRINDFLLGAVLMSAVLLSYLFFTNNLPFMQAAGVGTGAADINAKYHDGYATSLTAGSGVMYVSDGSNYLPDSTVDTGAIVDGTITSGDIADNTIVAGDIATNAIGSDEIAANSVGESELSVSLGGDWPDNISCGTGFTDMGTYCIQTNEANSGTGVNWYTASDYCHDNYDGARLCTNSEWYNGCANGGLTDITDNHEWTGTWYGTTFVITRGNGSCTALAGYGGAAGSNAFRCCK
jgi:hypothetical protein